MMERPVISYINSMGDSLSDRKTLYNRNLGDIVPMRWLSGLNGRSPDGRFTNGYVWTDDLSADLANQFTINKIRKAKHLDFADIGDAIITHDSKVAPHIESLYSLNNDRAVKYCGKNFVRSYNEGGTTAFDYSFWPSKSISRYFTRFIVSTLSKKREELLKDDKKYKISEEDKAKTLVIEWSGANDLITVNERPSEAEVNRAIKERVNNVIELIKNGYRHFILFDVPDLSLTPRYQKKNKTERDNAHRCSAYFSTQLKLACQQLQTTYPNCTIEMFDANKQFTKMYNNPEKYHLDRDKRTIPYVDSPDFEMKPNGTSPAKGEMFWDDVHPTAEVHALLAAVFLKKYENKFNFVEPTKSIKKQNDPDNNHHPYASQRLFQPTVTSYDGEYEFREEKQPTVISYDGEYEFSEEMETPRVKKKH